MIYMCKLLTRSHNLFSMGFVGNPTMNHLLFPSLFEEDLLPIQSCFSELTAGSVEEELGAFAASEFLNADLEYEEPSATSEEDNHCHSSSHPSSPGESDIRTSKSHAEVLYSRNAAWRELLDDRPRTIHLLISLLCIAGAFGLISLRRSSGPHLLEHKSAAVHAFDLADRSDPPSCAARGPNILARGAAAGALGARVLLGAGWAGIGTHYCGPPNGRDLAQAPADILDAVCAQHDFCIERSLYPAAGAAGAPRALYPVGVVDPDRFRRCGIPLQSHRTPGFAARIAACDRELLDSVRAGFRCSADPALPKGPWCGSDALAGRRPCDDHRGTWRQPMCRAALSLVELYHRWKVFRSAAPADAAPAGRNATLADGAAALRL
jgi:hypothetical protein